MKCYNNMLTNNIVILVIVPLFEIDREFHITTIVFNTETLPASSWNKVKQVRSYHV